MNFIDISSWQKGIDLSVLFAENPLDGVIVKATEGTGYVNPEFVGWAEWLRANGKPMGLYHYCEGTDAHAEAKHFFDNVKPYIGRAVLCADYETPATEQGTAWLKAFLDAFKELSGAKAVIYCSMSVIYAQDFNLLFDHPLWLAQYADMNMVNGFVDAPWQSGNVWPFPGYVMHQYTSCGRLSGWSGNLDFDLFKGNLESWQLLCGGAVALKGADPVVVSEVLSGKYGNGTDRASQLTADGYDATAVQDKVNELYGIAQSCRKYIRGNEEYINSIMKLVRLL